MQAESLFSLSAPYTIPMTAGRPAKFKRSAFGDKLFAARQPPGDRKRQRHPHHKTERRLDQVVQGTADPRDVVLVVSKDEHWAKVAGGHQEIRLSGETLHVPGSEASQTFSAVAGRSFTRTPAAL